MTTRSRNNLDVFNSGFCELSLCMKKIFKWYQKRIYFFFCCLASWWLDRPCLRKLQVLEIERFHWAASLRRCKARETREAFSSGHSSGITTCFRAEVVQKMRPLGLQIQSTGQTEGPIAQWMAHTTVVLTLNQTRQALGPCKIRFLNYVLN